jgi:hypothetical protein
VQVVSAAVVVQALSLVVEVVAIQVAAVHITLVTLLQTVAVQAEVGLQAML